MIRRLLMLSLSAAACSAAPLPPLLPGFHAEYSIVAYGLRAGTCESSLHWTQHRYHYVQHCSVRLPFYRQTETEESFGFAENGAVRPTRYQRTVGDERQTHALEKNHDPLSYQLQLALDAPISRKPLSYRVVTKKPERHYQFSRTGWEIVPTSFGRLQTLHLKARCGRRKNRSLAGPHLGLSAHRLRTRRGKRPSLDPALTKHPLFLKKFFPLLRFKTLDQGKQTRSYAMIKSKLIDAIHRKKSDLAERDVASGVSLLIEAMANELESGGRIEIRGFGSFSLHHRGPRQATTLKPANASPPKRSSARTSKLEKNCVNG